MHVYTLEQLDRVALAKIMALQAQIYAADPYYIANTPDAEWANFNNPAFAGRQAIVMIEAAGRLQAHAVARLGATPGAATIGGFEAVDAFEVCQQVLGTAEDWLRTNGARTVLGPMDGDTWHRYRFVLDPDQARPFLKEPWNPPYYPAQWEACGYRVTDRYRSSRIRRPEQAAEALAPYLRRVRRQGYTFRELRRDRLSEELSLLYQLSIGIFADNRHYMSISEAAFKKLYDGVEPLLVPGLCQFCMGPDGSPAGFVFCYPDYAEAVRAMDGKRNLIAKCRFLLCRRQANRVCIKSLGSLPAYRGTGVGPALMGLAFEQMLAAGYSEALMCLMHDDNDSRRLDGGASEPFREYVLYTKSLGAGS